jgi:hypothetical protein
MHRQQKDSPLTLNIYLITYAKANLKWSIDKKTNCKISERKHRRKSACP